MIEGDENEYVPYGRLLELAARLVFVGIILAVLYFAGAFGTPWTARAEECPPYWKCTPKGDWNDPNCRCWDSK